MEVGCGLLFFLGFLGLTAWLLMRSAKKSNAWDSLERSIQETQRNLQEAKKQIGELKLGMAKLQKEVASMKEGVILALPVPTPEPAPEPVEAPAPAEVHEAPQEPIFAVVSKALPEPIPEPVFIEAPEIPAVVEEAQPEVFIPLEAEPLQEAILELEPMLPPAAITEALPATESLVVAPIPPSQGVIPPPQPLAPAPSAPKPKPVPFEPARPKLKPLQAPSSAKPSPPSKPFDWESLVGVKLFSWIAGIALLVAAVTFLKFSLTQPWFTTSLQMALGLITGAGLLGFCETKRAQKYAITANSITAAGVAILFSTFFASHVLWKLIPNWGAFLCMALVTAVAVALSIRRDSIFIALLGLVGAFATPILLSQKHDNPIGLFGYLALLNVGLAWVGYRKRWPILKVLSILFTTIYQFGWVMKFLDDSQLVEPLLGHKLGIGLGVFLLFPIIAFGAMFLRERRHGKESEDIHPLFRHSTTFTCLPPLLFAFHMATTPAFGQHFGMMFGFLALVMTGLSAIAIIHGPEWFYTLGAFSTLLVWVGWLSTNYVPTAWPGVLLFVALFVLLCLGVPLVQEKLKRPPFEGPGKIGPYAAPLLLVAFPALAGLEKATATPWLLFGSLLVLGLVLAAFAIRRQDGLIHYITCLFMIAAEVVWSEYHLNPARGQQAVIVYGLIALFTLGVPWFAKGRDRALSHDHEIIPLFLALPPLFFAAFVLNVPEYGQEHYLLFFGFLGALVAWLGAVTLFHGPRWLHTISGAFTLLIWAGWLGNCYEHRTWPGVFGPLVIFVGLFLVVGALLERQVRTRAKAPANSPGIAVFTAPLLLFAFPVLVMREPLTASPGLLFGVLLGLMVALSAYSIVFEKGFVHFTACFFVLVTEALWSSKHLSPHNLMTALAIYGGYGLFYLGVPVYARNKGRVLRPLGSGAILAFASLGLLFFLALGHVAAVGLWPLAVLVGVLNLGLLYEASQGYRPGLCMTGMILSWILLGCSWFSAPEPGRLVSALAVMGAFGVLVVGGSLWLRQQRASQGQSAPFAEPEMFLGLVGHIFLLAVVVRPELSLPPWPWLGVLFVLVLALGTASIYIKRGALQMGSIIATQLVLITWAGALPTGSPWSGLAIWPPVCFAALGYLWDELARRRGAKDGVFPLASGVGIHLAQLALIVLGRRDLGAPHGGLVLAHTILVLLLLTLAWRRQKHGWAIALSGAMGILLLAWSFDHMMFLPGSLPGPWTHELTLAVPLYLLLLGYPILLGERARVARLPFFAALIGSAVCFLAGWQALVAGGYKAVIGALPVVQAMLLVPHLLRLLKLEPEGKRDLGRLASVAGGILAFITLAVPLQLDREWITLAWALLAASLAWLYTRVPHKGLLVWIFALMVTVFTRLVFNPSAYFNYHLTGSPILNWYLYTYLVTAACFFGAAWILSKTDDKIWELPRLSSFLPTGGAVLIFLLINIEIADAFSKKGEVLTFNLFHGSLAQQLSYTIGWALFAIGLLVAGVIARKRFTRLAAIVMLIVTIAKAFFLDISQLKGLYRVASFLGLTICLVLTAVVLKKYVLRQSEEEE